MNMVGDRGKEGKGVEDIWEGMIIMMDLGI